MKALKIHKSVEAVPQMEVGLPRKRFATKGLQDALRYWGKLLPLSEEMDQDTTRFSKASDIDLPTGSKDLTRSCVGNFLYTEAQFLRQ